MLLVSFYSLLLKKNVKKPYLKKLFASFYGQADFEAFSILVNYYS